MFGRKSLSSLGGPAVRGTPRSDLAPMKNAFARMSISERDAMKQEEQDEEMREGSVSKGYWILSRIYMTKEGYLQASPERDVKVESNQFVTPPTTSRHPAMSVSDNESSAIEVVSTPLQGLKNKLKDLRRKSIHVKQEDAADEKPFDRRATFGVSSFDTPKTRSSGFEHRGLSSAAPLSRFMPKLENARGQMHGDGLAGDVGCDPANAEEPAENDTEDSLHIEGDDLSSRGESEEQNIHAQAEQHEDKEVEGHSSADEIGLRQDDEAGPNDESDSPATSMLKGLREMMRTPKAQPGTPKFAGMREMFAEKPELATPEMSGIVDLFPELASSRGKAIVEQDSETASTAGPSASRLPTRNRIAGPTGKLPVPTKMATRVTAPVTRTRAKPAVEASSTSQSTASTTSSGIRRARAPPASESGTSSAKPKVTRTRQAQELASSTSTEEPSAPVKKTTTRPVRTRTATAEVEERSAVKPAAKPATRTAAVRTRAKSAAPEPAVLEQEDGEADPLGDISVPEPDPEDIKPIRKTTRTATAGRTAGVRPLATRSALPQPSAKAESPEVEMPKTRTRTTTAPTSRVLKSSTETEEVIAPAPKRATRATAGSRLTAPTASSKARATPPPAAAPAAPVRKTRAATATIAEGTEAAEVSGIPKRVTRARK